VKRHAFAAVLLVAAPAGWADPVASVKLGALDHNIRVTEGKNANKESGANISAQLNVSSPGLLNVLGSPEPWVIVSVNTDGNTSYAGLGLEWDWEFASGWHVEPGFGYVIHDGEINNPFPAGTQAAVDFSRDRVLLGSRDLFRTSLALTRDFGERWGAQVIYEHLSHGQIIGEGRNQGLDALGVRLVRRFD
jgi:lipid A 3-O-deacylase